jgi:hypothetical protein
MRAYSGGLGQPFERSLDTGPAGRGQGLQWATGHCPTAPRSGLECVSFDRWQSDWKGLPPRQTPAKSPVRAQPGDSRMDSTGRRSKEKGETVHHVTRIHRKEACTAVFSSPSRTSPDQSLRGGSLEMLHTQRHAARRPRPQLQHEDSEGLHAQKTGVTFDELDYLLARISTLVQPQTPIETGGST